MTLRPKEKEFAVEVLLKLEFRGPDEIRADAMKTTHEALRKQRDEARAEIGRKKKTDLESYLKKHGAPGAVTSYLFTREGYWGKSETRKVVVDAGLVFVPPPAPTTVREPVLLMPGAPLPEGYEKQPAPAPAP